MSITILLDDVESTTWTWEIANKHILDELINAIAGVFKECKNIDTITFKQLHLVTPQFNRLLAALGECTSIKRLVFVNVDDERKGQYGKQNIGHLLKKTKTIKYFEYTMNGDSAHLPFDVITCLCPPLHALRVVNFSNLTLHPFQIDVLCSFFTKENTIKNLSIRTADLLCITQLTHLVEKTNLTALTIEDCVDTNKKRIVLDTQVSLASIFTTLKSPHSQLTYFKYKTKLGIPFQRYDVTEFFTLNPKLESVHIMCVYADFYATNRPDVIADNKSLKTLMLKNFRMMDDNATCVFFTGFKHNTTLQALQLNPRGFSSIPVLTNETTDVVVEAMATTKTLLYLDISKWYTDEISTEFFGHIIAFNTSLTKIIFLDRYVNHISVEDYQAFVRALWYNKTLCEIDNFDLNLKRECTDGLNYVLDSNTTLRKINGMMCSSYHGHDGVIDLGVYHPQCRVIAKLENNMRRSQSLFELALPALSTPKDVAPISDAQPPAKRGRWQ
jgi:hypothetical protein